MRRKGFTLPLILIVSALAIGIGITFIYFQVKTKTPNSVIPTFQPTPQSSTQSSKPKASPRVINITYDENISIEGWKLYRNNDYKFEFIIPWDMWESLQGPMESDIENYEIRGSIESYRGNNSENIGFGYKIIDVNWYKTEVMARDSYNREDIITSKPEKYRSAPVDFVNSKTANEILFNYERLQAFYLCGETEVCPKLDNIEYLEINQYPTLKIVDKGAGYSGNTWISNTYTILFNNKIYKFSFSWDPKRNDANERQAIFNKIINSLKIDSGS